MLILWIKISVFPISDSLKSVIIVIAVIVVATIIIIRSIINAVILPMGSWVENITWIYRDFIFKTQTVI